MTTTKLIALLGGVCVLSVTAYLIISPIARTSQDIEIDALRQEMQQSGAATTTNEGAAAQPGNSTPSDPTPSASQTTPKPPQTTQENPQEPVAPAPAPAASTGYTQADVALHASESSCWSIINNGVYDLTTYITKHPGGAKNIIRICGKDGTSSFEGQHGGESRPERTLEAYYIGPLK